MPPDAWAKSVTVASGSLVVPRKFGWTTLVILSELEMPESLAGSEFAGQRQGHVGNVGGVGDRGGRAVLVDGH